jgi:hypothetical protein
MGLDLRCYLDQFPEVCSKKFGRAYDLAGLEGKLAQLRNGERPLTAKDVTKLFNSDFTPFGNYWPKPHVKVLEETLSAARIKLGPIPPNPAELVQRLLDVFHNLGITSLLLQFVYPERFAIFSTPLIHLVQVTRPALVDMYLAYCDELKVWTEHFQLPSVSATSTALWTFAEVSKRAAEDPEAHKVRLEFENDLWVQRRVLAQSLRPFLKRYGRLQLAHILVDEDHRIAGKIAAEEFERLINVASERLHGKTLRQEMGTAPRFLSELSSRGIIDLVAQTELRRAWDIRNRVVHPDNRQVSLLEVQWMVETVERHCVPWESWRNGSGSKRRRK